MTPFPNKVTLPNASQVVSPTGDKVPKHEPMQAVLFQVYTLTEQKIWHDSGSHCRLQRDDMVLTLSFQKRADGKFEDHSRGTEEENV